MSTYVAKQSLLLSYSAEKLLPLVKRGVLSSFDLECVNISFLSLCRSISSCIQGAFSEHIAIFCGTGTPLIE